MCQPAKLQSRAAWEGGCWGNWDSEGCWDEWEVVRLGGAAEERKFASGSDTDGNLTKGKDE